GGGGGGALGGRWGGAGGRRGLPGGPGGVGGGGGPFGGPPRSTGNVPDGVGRGAVGHRCASLVSPRFPDTARLARPLLSPLAQGDVPAGGDGRSNRPAGAKAAPDRAQAMDMDTWYELRLREMSDLNAAANELLREANEVLRSPDDAEEEEEQRRGADDDPDRSSREAQ